MRGDTKLYNILNGLNIHFEYYEHPPVPNVDNPPEVWTEMDAAHCKNLFFRNHKGNRHYLVLIEYSHTLSIKDLEQRLKQGKLTFASGWRLKKYLGLEPGSVTPFGLIHDKENHVHIFIDKNLKNTRKISFHPLINTASLAVKTEDFINFMNWTKNSYEFTELY